MTDAFRGVVAIDGPSGSGKSSVAKAVARSLRLRYLDTGAMYRAVTSGALQAQIALDDAAAVAEFARRMDLPVPTDPDAQRIVINGADVTEAIRTSEVSEAVSAVATNLDVRAELVRRQREIVAAGAAIVLEGRDTTTVVAPNAAVRLLITADPQARIARRAAELHETVDARTMGATTAQIIERDAKDSTVVEFHQAADGVITVDTSHLSLESSIETVLRIIAEADGKQTP
ncbi:MAG: (d)CMP kinase [Cumulibacter sp.]